MPSEQSDDTTGWTPESTYKFLRRAVIDMQVKENPTDCMLVCTERQLRVSLCANGSIPVRLFDQALEMLQQNGEIVRGETYLSYPRNAQMAREAIEYVAATDDPDRQFIGRMNALLSGGAFEK